jgi:alkylation response protein AidB-like acyl-CoA dehydrogenase
MMRDSVKEFVDKELWAHKDRFEKIMLIREEYEKSRDLGLLGVAVPEAYGGLGMGFVSTMVAITFLVQQDLSQLLLEHIRESVLCQ